LKNTQNYVKQRLFLGNTLTREAGHTLLSTNSGLEVRLNAIWMQTNTKSASATLKNRTQKLKL
jgi:hypothetical protein